jgi:hypothetical protein
VTMRTLPDGHGDRPPVPWLRRQGGEDWAADSSQPRRIRPSKIPIRPCSCRIRHFFDFVAFSTRVTR